MAAGGSLEVSLQVVGERAWLIVGDRLCGLVTLGPGRDDGFLGDEAGDQRRRGVPIVETGRGEDRCDEGRDLAVEAVASVDVGERTIPDGNGAEQPDHGDGGHDDAARRLEKATKADPGEGQDHAWKRQLIAGKVDEQRIIGQRANGSCLEHQTDSDDEEDRHDVHGEDDRTGAGPEERRCHQHVHRQPGAARGVGNDECHQETLPSVWQHPRCADGRHVAAEPDHQGQKRPTGEPDHSHQPVGDDCAPSQVTRVLEHGQAEEHDGHHGHERQQHADTGDQSADDEPLDHAAAKADPAEQPFGRPRDRAGDQLVEGVL